MRFVAEPAKHIVALDDEVTVGREFTVTLTVLVLLHRLPVPVMVYVLETVGLATTLLPVVTFNPVDGDHV